ncbi:MAG: DUF3604 domain-containing protein [Pseudomonadota bacterium]
MTNRDSVNRFSCLMTLLALTLQLLIVAPAGAATEWVATEPARTNLPFKVLNDIPELSDPTFKRAIDQLATDLVSLPTNGDNVAARAALLGQYYDALQNDGVLLNWRIGSEINQLRSRAAAGRLAEDKSLFPLLERRFTELRAAHEARGRTGKMVLRKPAKPVLNAKTYTTVEIDYQVDTPLEPGARIRMGQNWYSDLGRLQFTRPMDANYATATTNRRDVKLVTGSRVWLGGAFTGLSGGNRPTITVNQGRLEAGDRIRFVLGDTSEGSPGWLVQSFTNDAMDLRFEIDFNGDGVFVPVAQPRFQVDGKTASHIRVVAPSVIRPGEAFRVRASVEDEYFNRAALRVPKRLLLWNGPDIIKQSGPIRGDRAVFHFEDVVINSDPATPVYLRVTDTTGSYSGTSNPVVTRTTGPRLYWGELHGHEGYTDANGTPEWYLNFAKNVAFLDFASLTGHDIMLSEVHFRHNFLVSDAFDVPDDGFVAFRAYEWTNSWRFGGHHNVFLLDDRQLPVTVMQAPELRDMVSMQRKYNDPDKVLIIPHAHQPGDWDVAGADLVEIFSQHGSFEWFGREYLMKGHKVGLHAASDDHLGHPGNSPSRGRSRGGLGAVFAMSNDKKAIFDNLKARHTYGTSFARIYLETNVNGSPMGETVTAQGNLELSGFVAGTAEIADITLVVNGEDAQMIRFDEPAAESARLRFRLHLDSTPGENPNAPRTPRGDKRYWGRIFVHAPGEAPGLTEGSSSQTVIEKVEPLGTEHYADRIAQTGRHEATFTFRVRGDNDGALLSLNNVSPDDLVTVVIMTSPIAETEHWNMQTVPELPGEYFNSDVPRREVLVQETVRLGDLQDNLWSTDFDERASVDLALVGENLPLYRAFRFALTEQDGLMEGDSNHVYVRVRQLDDETAWSSPTFVDWSAN